MEWISVKDRLPEIPDGHHGITVLVAVFDPVYNECCPGHGYSVYEAFYPTEQSGYFEYGFKELCTDGSWVDIVDAVTHWMYRPAPPPITEELLSEWKDEE